MNSATQRNADQAIPFRPGFLTKAVNLSEKNAHRWALHGGNYSADRFICLYILENDPFQRS